MGDYYEYLKKEIEKIQENYPIGSKEQEKLIALFEKIGVRKVIKKFADFLILHGRVPNSEELDAWLKKS